MRAITVHRPWDRAICHPREDGGKRIENRPWKLPADLIGEPIALHAGKAFDKEGAAWMKEGLFVPPDDDGSPMGIVGAFTVSHIVEESDDPWFFGPFGWVIDAVLVLPEPIPCRGWQRLWYAPKEAEQTIRSMTPAHLGWFE